MVKLFCCVWLRLGVCLHVHGTVLESEVKEPMKPWVCYHPSNAVNEAPEEGFILFRVNEDLWFSLFLACQSTLAPRFSAHIMFFRKAS